MYPRLTVCSLPIRRRSKIDIVQAVGRGPEEG